MDPRLLANLAALQEARELIEEAVPEPTPEDERASLLERQAQQRRPTPAEAAKAWKARNGEYRRRRSVTISEPGQAVEVWLDGIRPKTGGDRPPDAGQRAPRAGKTAEEQVVAKVRQTYATFEYAQGLEAAIQAWPLPMTFYDDVAPLCGVEEELLADPRPYEPEPEEVDEIAGEDRLIRGMKRAEEGGLHG